jgi:IPT/TIG domain
MRPIPVRMTLAAAAACLGLATCGPIATASAKPATQITSIEPASGPELSSIPVTIHGSNFSTEPGGTTVSFGGEAATSVKCVTNKRCTAMTPELFEGPVEVTATSNSMTSTATIVFTYEMYAPPLVKITNDGGEPVFAQHKLLDRYAGIFDPGNVYLNIENTFPGPVTITGPTGYTELGEDEVAGFNIPAQSMPYLFAVDEGAKHQTLSLKARTPR